MKKTVKLIDAKLQKTVVIVVCLLVFSAPVHALTNEYILKAAYIKNFAYFIEWPSALQKKYFQIGLYQPNEESLRAFQSLAAQTQIKNKPVAIICMNSLAHAQACDIIYIQNISKEDIQFLLTQIRGLPIVIVCDQAKSAYWGCHVEFFNTPESYLRFKINLNAFNNNQLQISSKLLKLAEIIKEKEASGESPVINTHDASI